MWQFLVAAAVAGSTSLVAKHLLTPTPDPRPAKAEEEKNPEDSRAASVFESPGNCFNLFGYEESSCQQQQQRDGIFRFSSSGSSGKKKKKVRYSRAKSVVTCRRLKYGKENEDNKSGGGGKLAVCSKKRRTAKSAPSSSTKDSSLFSWGLGVGMMCMMSAGKAEISKLSAAMDKTSKVVDELSTELYKRKLTQVASGSNNTSNKNIQVMVDGSSRGDGARLPMNDDVDCPSSVLTEEQEPEVLEMDQLEAELESELLKLPWSSSEASGNQVMRTNQDMTEDLSNRVPELEEEAAAAYQCHGVLPSELDKKLCHLLIGQQENQIVELESELHLAQSKLHEKEAELQALKDCVRRLTEFSLSNISDDEFHGQGVQELRAGEMGFEPRGSVVGTKRPINSA